MQHPGDTWRTAAARNTTEASDATSIQTLSQSLVNDLQTRELSASDYDLLLSLDSTNTNNMQAVTTSSQLPHTPAPPPRRIPKHFRIEPLDHGNPLLISGAFCEICCEQFQRGEWIRKLPCKHKVYCNILLQAIILLKCFSCMTDHNSFTEHVSILG